MREDAGVGGEDDRDGRVHRGRQLVDGGVRSAGKLSAGVVATHPPPPRHPLGRRGTDAAVAAVVAAVRVPARASAGSPANRPGGRRDGQAPGRHVRAAAVICGHKRRMGDAECRRFNGGGRASTPAPSIHSSAPPPAHPLPPPSPFPHRPPAPLPGSACGGWGEGRRAAASGWRMWKQTRPPAAAARGGGRGAAGGRVRAGCTHAAADAAAGSGGCLRGKRHVCTDRPAAAGGAVHTAQSAPTGGSDWSAGRGGPAAAVCLARAAGAGLSGATPRLSCGTRGAPQI